MSDKKAIRRKSYSSPYRRPSKHEKGALKRTLIPSIRFDIEETPERRISPTRLQLHSERTLTSCLSALSYFRENSPTSCLPLTNTSLLAPATPLSLHSPSSTTSLLVPSVSLSLLSPCSNASLLAPPIPSNSTGVQQNAPRLAVKKPKLSINISDMTTIIINPCLKPIGLTPVRRSFKSAMDEGRDAASMEEVDLIDDDEVFIKDLDSNIVHKLSLRDMPNLPATF